MCITCVVLSRKEGELASPIRGRREIVGDVRQNIRYDRRTPCVPYFSFSPRHKQSKDTWTYHITHRINEEKKLTLKCQKERLFRLAAW